MLDYYKEKQYIPRIDEQGNVKGSVERWEAHKKGILHKGFTVSLTISGKLYLTRRKHPVFDGVVDFSLSSHPLMIDGKIENEIDAVLRCISREAGLIIESKTDIKNLGSIVYHAKDPLSRYIEHEYCTFYSLEIDKKPKFNMEYIYGYELLSPEYLDKYRSNIHFAPWILSGMNDKLF